MSVLIPTSLGRRRPSGLIVPPLPGDPPSNGNGGNGGNGEDPGADLLGVGGPSTSLNDYPKTGPVTEGDIFVEPDAATNGNGSEGSPFNDFLHALSVVPDGERILVKQGTINLTSTLDRNTAWNTGIEVFAYGEDRPVIDLSGLPTGTTNDGIGIWFKDGSEGEHWKGFEIINGPDMAIQMGGWNSTCEDIWAHHVMSAPGQIGRAALRMYGGGARGLLYQDCAVWRLGDGTSSFESVPDGYQMTANSGQIQTGCRRVRCFGAHCPDDTFDMFRANGCEDIDCVSYFAGRYWNGNAGGGGSAFKLGGNESGIGDNLSQGGLDVQSRSEGVKPNTSPLGSEFRNITSVDAENYAFNMSTTTEGDEEHLMRSNIAWAYGQNAGDTDVTDSAFNTWDESPEPDPLFADPANYDWSLGSGSPCIEAGEGGVNQGASEVALAIAKVMIPHALANS